MYLKNEFSRIFVVYYLIFSVCMASWRHSLKHRMVQLCILTNCFLRFEKLFGFPNILVGYPDDGRDDD